MTLLYVDGFSHYDSDGILSKWTNKGSYNVISSGAGRYGGNALQITYVDGWVYRDFPTAPATVIVGFAYMYFNDSPLTNAVIALSGGGTQNVSVGINSSNRIIVYRGSLGGLAPGVLLGTGTKIINPNTFYYIEVKATIDNSTGSVEVRVDGVADILLTGIDTQNGGVSGTDRLALGQQASFAYSMQGKYCDLYMCDTSGSKNNNFLGDCRVDTLFATGAGNYTQFTPSTAPNYSCVNKTIQGSTPYVSDSNVGNQDSYAFADLPPTTSSTVYGVQLNAYARTSDAGSRSLATMARLAGVDEYAAGESIPSSFRYLSQVLEDNPSAANWTESSINAAEFGMKVTA